MEGRCGFSQDLPKAVTGVKELQLGFLEWGRGLSAWLCPCWVFWEEPEASCAGPGVPSLSYLQ